MKDFVTRRPLSFGLLLTLALFGLTFVCRAAFPRVPVANIKDLPTEAFKPPSALDRVVDAVANPDTLFWGLAILLSLVLLAWTGGWREAGFNRPSRWRNLRFLVFPLLVGVLALSGGVFFSGPGSLVASFVAVLVATFGQELVFRGVLWRALAPADPVRAMIVTSLLSGALILGRTITDGPWPEAARLTIMAVCGGFAYAALRWRTTSIWPVIILHTAFAFAVDISTLGTATYPLFMLLSTLGFLAYGIFLLRNRRALADGGLTRPQPARVI